MFTVDSLISFDNNDNNNQNSNNNNNNYICFSSIRTRQLIRNKKDASLIMINNALSREIILHTSITSWMSSSNYEVLKGIVLQHK